MALEDRDWYREKPSEAWRKLFPGREQPSTREPEAPPTRRRTRRRARPGSWVATLAIGAVLGLGFAAWQDNRLGNNDIFFTSSADGGTTFTAAERVDDTGAGQSEQSRPSIAWSEGWCYVAWEDNRSGMGDVFTGRRSCPAQ